MARKHDSMHILRGQPAPVEVMERPILFTGPMVNAILQKGNAVKTATRRLRGLTEVNDLTARGCVPRYTGIEEDTGMHVFSMLEDYGVVCPYGQAGERLWVREHYRVQVGCGGLARGRYGADGEWFTAPTRDDKHPGADPHARKSVPSIHMPRWASRLTLQIESVRAERLQRIDNPQAIREGIYDGGHRGSKGYKWENGVDGKRYLNPREAFKALWEGINGTGDKGWASDPWVWVVEFTRVDAA